VELVDIVWLATYPNCWLCENGVGVGETAAGDVEVPLTDALVVLTRAGLLLLMLLLLTLATTRGAEDESKTVDVELPYIQVAIIGTGLGCVVEEMPQNQFVKLLEYVNCAQYG
jgi:hypothetical protein